VCSSHKLRHSIYRGKLFHANIHCNRAKVQLDLRAKRIRIFKREEKKKASPRSILPFMVVQIQEAKDQEFLPEVRKILS